MILGLTLWEKWKNEVISQECLCLLEMRLNCEDWGLDPICKLFMIQHKIAVLPMKSTLRKYKLEKKTNYSHISKSLNPWKMGYESLIDNKHDSFTSEFDAQITYR